MLSALLIALQSAPAPGTEPQTAPSSLISFIPMVLIVVVFWFVLIQPERKNRKKREAMLAAVEKGARVMTTGGLYGTVAALQDDAVVLQVDEGVRLRFARSAIQSVLADDEKSDGKEKK